ncbi:peptide chain release factor N(5)-glutamine methyltransferase [Pseudovibrio flavus]|uniref:peptide chain release factor N(5)-glutamine methyltransferase n=1 Tax=Pseudovibrio flavus TaxID=2529854 RepID=UPI0035280757
MKPQTLEALYRSVRAAFREAGFAEAELDARVLVARAAGLEPKELVLNYDRIADEVIAELVANYREERLSGKPVGRILGTRQFWGLEFALNEATLEPRPDTEVLIETALAYCEQSHGIEYPWVFADIGTGTGAIAIALLSELPKAICVAVDISERALEAARENARQNGVSDRFLAVCADYTSALSGNLDFLVSNPPYIRTSVVEELAPEVRNHDPIKALDGGEDGLIAYRELVESCKNLLKPQGFLTMEIGFDQAADLAQIAENNGISAISCVKDLSGNDRVVTIVYP